jgi:hypothetical protein
MGACDHPGGESTEGKPEKASRELDQELKGYGICQKK